MPNKYIIYEGIDQVGKTTMISMSKGWLEQKGVKVRTVAQPGTTLLGQRLREILKHDKDISLGPETEAMMFALDHMAFIEDILLNSHDEWILSDRNDFISGLIYQVLKGVDPDRLSKFYEIVMSHPKIHNSKADAVIIFQIPNYVLMTRRARNNGTGKWDRYESNHKYMDDVYNAYTTLTTTHGDRIRNIIKPGGKLIQVDASGDIETVFNQVQKVLSNLLEN